MSTSSNRRFRSGAATFVVVGAVVICLMYLPSGAPLPAQPETPDAPLPEVVEIASRSSAPTTERIEFVDARRLVTGRLVWSDGVPVVGASVRCDLAADSTDTGADGRFEFRVAAEALRAARGVVITAHPTCWLPSEPGFVQRIECAGDSTAQDGLVAVGNLAVPATVDVEVVFDFERVATQIAVRAGYDLVRVRVGAPSPRLRGMLAGAVASIEFDLAEPLPVHVLRVPVRDQVHVVAELKPSTQWAVVRNHIATTVTPLTRDKPARAVVPLRSANLLSGKVVDHEGRPLRLASLKLEQVALDEGGRLCITRSFDDGTFLIIGAPGEAFVAEAQFENAKSPKYELVVGNLDYELQCPTEALRRVRVRSGAVPVTRYDFSENSLLFGQRDEQKPKLTEHPDGMCFLARRDQDLCSYLCWRDGEQFREATVRIPPRTGNQVVEIDVATLAVEPRGVLTIRYGSEPRTLRIRRVRPVPDSGFHAFVAGAASTDPRPLNGIPAGIYEVEVRVTGAHPFKPPLATAECEFAVGENIIDVEARVRR